MAEPITHTFPSEAEWLEGRLDSIGGSESPQILGLTPWGGPQPIWAAKRRLLPPQESTEAMHWGRILEPLVAARYREETGYSLADPGPWTFLRNPDYPFLHASIDRYVSHPDRGIGLLSIKTTSAYRKEDWSEDVPPAYQVQLQHEMMVSGLRWGAVAVLIGGQTFRYLDLVEYDPAFCARLLVELQLFWRHVESGDPPPADASQACREALRRMYPKESGQVIALDAALVEADESWLEAKKQLDYWQEKKDLAENQLRQAIGEATAGVLPNAVSWTNKSQTRKSYVVPEATFRVLRRSAKKG